MKNILIISPEPWNGYSVSKHHYARTLAKQGYRVYFLSPPNNSLLDIAITKTEYDNLFEVQAPQVAKGLRFYPKFLRIYLEHKWLLELEKKIATEIDVVWLFENSRFFNMEFAKDRLKIYHQVDLNQNYHVKEASMSADICFSIAENIKNNINKYNKNIYKIGHGLNKDTIINTPLQYRENIKNDSKNVAYIGNLDMIYINEIMIRDIIKKHPQITFHFIGSYSKDGDLYNVCKQFKNVVWWGRIESKYIESILKMMDIHLIAYRVEEYGEQLTNTHKLLEYLYSGKVVVSTYLDEYKDKRYLLEMVDNSKDYIDKFDEVVNNLEFYNSTEKQQQRIAFAKEHTYENSLKR